MKTLDDAIRELHSETDLTTGIMLRIAMRMKLTNPDLLNDLYETVIFYTGDHDPNHGFGSSDFGVVYREFEKRYLQSLQPGEEVIETEQTNCMWGSVGEVYESKTPGPTYGSHCVKWTNGMGTSITHGTRRLKDVQMEEVTIRPETRELIRDLRGKDHQGQTDDQILYTILFNAVHKPTINWQARGQLIASHRIEGDRYIVLVDTGSKPQPYVVSDYNNGSQEWDSGDYKEKYDQALAAYHEKVQQAERSNKPEEFKFTEA